MKIRIAVTMVLFTIISLLSTVNAQENIPNRIIPGPEPEPPKLYIWYYPQIFGGDCSVFCIEDGLQK